MSAVKYDFCGGVLVESICETKPPNTEGKKRGIVKEFSTKSASNMGRYLRGCRADYTHMVTLTYPADDKETVKCKSHLKAMLLRMYRSVQERSNDVNFARSLQAGGKVFSCFWFVEFTRRGTPHFHIFTTHSFNKADIARWWADIVKSEHESHERAGTRFERLRSGRGGTVSYAKKYAQKLYQKELPDLWKDSGIGRFWGVTGCREVVEAATLLQIGGRHGKHHNFIAKCFISSIEHLEKCYRLRRIDTPMCRLWVTDDERIRKHIFELIRECNELKADDYKVLQKASTLAGANLYRSRRGKDSMLCH